MPLLKADKITKIYELGNYKIHALKDVSLEIEEGDFLAIVGKSGSGKSTLMHILGLLDSPTAGEIYLDGKNVSQLSEKRLAKIRNEKIGFVFQSFNLMARTTALDNVLLPLHYSKKPKKLWHDKALEILDLVGLKDRIYNKSNELSGGQKQRVAIARALINDPSIIFADEPTGNLDSKTGDEIEALLKDLNSKGRTIVLVTHDEDLAKIARREIVLQDGKIVND
jgi:putative ABC transport system ATP-binding protein